VPEAVVDGFERSTSMKSTVGCLRVRRAANIASLMWSIISDRFGRPVSESVNALRTRCSWVRAFALTDCTTRAITTTARRQTLTARTARSRVSVASVSVRTMMGATRAAVVDVSLAISGEAGRDRPGVARRAREGWAIAAPARGRAAMNAASIQRA
jgi:hypothetical protein